MRTSSPLARPGLILLFLAAAPERVAGYSPFTIGAPPTYEMVRDRCPAEAEVCAAECLEYRFEPNGRAVEIAPEKQRDDLTDEELGDIVKLGVPAAKVKANLRKVHPTKLELKQLLAYEERSEGTYGNRLVVKRMLIAKTPSDKYKSTHPSRFCCREMLKAVLNGTYPLMRIAPLPDIIRPVVHCFVPGLKVAWDNRPPSGEEKRLIHLRKRAKDLGVSEEDIKKEWDEPEALCDFATFDLIFPGSFSLGSCLGSCFGFKKHGRVGLITEQAKSKSGAFLDQNEDSAAETEDSSMILMAA